MRQRTDEQTTRLTLVLGAVMATGPLAVDMYLPALPTLEAQFGVDAARVQHTLSAYLLGMAVGQLFFGPLADRYGRKAPLLAGLAIYGLASGASALAGGIGSLVAARFVQALGGASGIVLIRAIIRDRFDVLQSARLLSLMLLVMGVAPILAPLAGGWILVYGSWRLVFVFLAAFSVLCIALVASFLDESHPHERRSRSLAHAFAGFAPIARDRRFLGPALVFVFAFGAFFAYLAAAPFVFIQDFAVAPERFGWYFGANAVGFIGMSQVNRRLVGRWGPRRVLGWGVGALAAAAGALALSAASGLGGFAGVVVPVFVAISSMGLIVSNASVIAMAPFGERAGGASSLLGATQALGGVAASAAVGALGAKGVAPMAAVIAACAAAAAAAYFRLVRAAEAR